MANCAICTEFDNCPWRSDPDAMCSAFKQRPMTNGDRIRAMSDEELAELFETIHHSRKPSTYTTDGFCIDDGLRTKSQWLDWLKQEANDEEIQP